MIYMNNIKGEKIMKKLIWKLLLCLLIVIPTGPILNTKLYSVTTYKATDAISNGSLTTQGPIIILFIILIFYIMNKRHLHIPKISYLYSTYTFYIITSIIWSSSQELSIRRVISTVMIILICYILGSNYYNKGEKSYINIAKDLIFIGYFNCTILILQTIIFGNFDIFRSTWRFGGTGANQVGFLLAPSLIICYIYYSNSNIWKSNMHRKSAMFLFTTCLIMTKSRTAIIGSIISIIVAYMIKHKLKIKNILVGIIMLIIFPVIFTNKQIIGYFTRGESLESLMSFSERTTIWSKIFEVLGYKYVFGSGYGGFWTPYNYERIKIREGFTPTSSHNGYIDEITSTGILGLFIWIVSSISTYITSLKLIKHNNESGYIGISITIFFVIMNFMETLTRQWYVFPTMVYTIVVFYISAESSRSKIEEQKNENIINS